MQTVAAFFPVARPRGAASVFLAGSGEQRSLLTEAVALAFAIRDAGAEALAAHTPAPAVAAAAC